MTETNQRSKEAFSFTDRITGREVLQLTNSEKRSVHAYYDIPPWCPVTRRIAFTRLAHGATEGEIVVMAADGNNVTRIARSRYVSANEGAMPQWSRDGHRVYFRDREEDSPVLAWVDLTSGARGAWPGNLRMIRPTGNQQAHHGSHNYADEEIVRRRDELGVFLQDLDIGTSSLIASVADCWRIHPRRDEIARWHLFTKHTKWSPDGDRLMFVFSNVIPYSVKYAELPRVHDIYVVNADGTGLVRVGEFGDHPSWHPNGREILANIPFKERPGNSLVCTDVDTGEQRLAAGSIAGVGHPSYSPNGARIAVDHAVAGEGYGSINLVDVATDTVTHLSQMRTRDHSHVGTHIHPVWSRDGTQILYASDASGVAQLCVLNV